MNNLQPATLIGKYYHRLEAKGRLSLPSVFRQVSENWIITRGLDGCLFVFRDTDFETQLAKLASGTFTKKAHRDMVRLLANEAANLTIDQNGRVHLPEYLIEYAKLTKEVVIVGSINRLEIWDSTRYHQYLEELEKNADAIAESIDDQTAPTSIASRNS